MGGYHSSPIKAFSGPPAHYSIYGAKSVKTPVMTGLPRPVSNPRHGYHDTSTFGFPRMASSALVSNTSLFNKRQGGSRRESFKPRPSADGGVENTSSVGGNGKPWAQFMTRVQEEVGY